MSVPRVLFAAIALACAACALAMARGLEQLSDQLSGALWVYTVDRGDTLTSVSARFGVGAGVIASRNGLEPSARLLVGQTLLIDNRHIVPLSQDRPEIVINIPQRMLFRFEDGIVVDAFPVAVGRPDWPTPRGEFRVTAKEEHPSWEVPRSIQEEMRRSGQRVLQRVPPGPGNPLGDYWLGLSLGAVGIHGTPYQTSIYRFATHGCIRLHADDVATLFPRVTVGAAGRIIYEPVLLARTLEGIFLEANGDRYGLAPRNALQLLRPAAEAAGVTSLIDWHAAEDVLKRREGVARRIGGEP